MRIDVRRLLAGEINRIALDYSFPIDKAGEPDDGSEADEPIDTTIDRVVFAGPVRVSGEIVNMGGYMRFEAEASIEYDAECARCLKPLHRSFSVTLERTVVTEGSLENTPEDEADDYLEAAGGWIDPDRTIVEELMMEFPTRELCSEDCKGLCPKCGKDLNEGDCGCVKKEIDPRLAILQKLLEKE